MAAPGPPSLFWLYWSLSRGFGTPIPSAASRSPRCIRAYESAAPHVVLENADVALCAARRSVTRAAVLAWFGAHFCDGRGHQLLQPALPVRPGFEHPEQLPARDRRGAWDAKRTRGHSVGS